MGCIFGPSVKESRDPLLFTFCIELFWQLHFCHMRRSYFFGLLNLPSTILMDLMQEKNRGIPWYSNSKFYPLSYLVLWKADCWDKFWRFNTHSLFSLINELPWCQGSFALIGRWSNLLINRRVSLTVDRISFNSFTKLLRIIERIQCYCEDL